CRGGEWRSGSSGSSPWHRLLAWLGGAMDLSSSRRYHRAKGDEGDRQRKGLLSNRGRDNLVQSSADSFSAMFRCAKERSARDRFRPDPESRDSCWESL